MQEICCLLGHGWDTVACMSPAAVSAEVDVNPGLTCHDYPRAAGDSPNAAYRQAAQELFAEVARECNIPVPSSGKVLAHISTLCKADPKTKLAKSILLSAKTVPLDYTQRDTEEDHAVKLLQRALAAPHPPPVRRSSTKKIHLTAPLIGLVEGLLYGDATVGEALKWGNFGLGTLNGLDGEVVILDGQAYQQGAEGASVLIDPSAQTPFMCTTSFDKQQAISLELPMPLDWSGLQQALQEQFLSANVFYALLVEGMFTEMRARSVRKQATGRPLAAVAREQAVFELEEQEGSLIGFWSPPFMGSAVTVPGFHLHFLSADRQRGGHVLEAKLLRGTAYIQPVYHAETDIPKSLEFLKADLSRDPAADIEQAEK
ncbi:hypothetical protein N2152v2_011287 [Parachlorella kessleri]